MTIDWANVVGLIGSTVFLAAFAYANASPKMDKLLFNAANLVGAMLLLASLSVHFNLAVVVLELCWGIIALFGLVQAIRARKAPQP